MYSKAALIFVGILGSMSAPAQNVVSPEVNSDRTVVFRLKAPKAQEVLLRCEGVSGSAMAKGDNGVWSLTTSPLEPDIYA